MKKASANFSRYTVTAPLSGCDAVGSSRRRRSAGQLKLRGQLIGDRWDID